MSKLNTAAYMFIYTIVSPDTTNTAKYEYFFLYLIDK